MSVGVICAVVTVLLMVWVFLNSCPTMGMLPSPGTCRTFRESVSTRMPPITAVPPSGMRTWVVACCVDTEN